MAEGVTVSRAEFVSLQGDVRSLLGRVDDLLRKFEPLLLARSGDEEKLRGLEADIRASHDKHRQHFSEISGLKEELRIRLADTREENRLKLETTDQRMDRVEDRQKRVLYGLAALAAAVELLARGQGAIETLRGLF